MARDDLSDLTDEELLLARDQVLDEFATALEILHIACGAPPKLALKKQADKDGRCPLPTSTLSEVFNGKKLPGLDFTMELIRQLRPDDAELQDEWRARWAKAKYTTTQAAKAQKRLEKDADQARDRAAGDIDRLREEAAAELQRASLLRTEAEKAVAEAQAEAARLVATAEQTARSTELSATARAEEILAKALDEAEGMRREAQQGATPESSEPADTFAPEQLLRRFLGKEFSDLTEPGASTWHALVQRELVQGHLEEPAPRPPTRLSDLWRTLHLLALRLPPEDAEGLRTRWRSIALGTLGYVDGDGLVPGLPGIVEALRLRNPESTMTQAALHNHAQALLARGAVTGIEIPGKLRYILALVQEYAYENQLLARYDHHLAVALDSLSTSPVPLSYSNAMDSYPRRVNDRLTELARSLGRDAAQVHLALVKADEVLAALVPDPLPRRDSWWYYRRRALQKKLSSYLVSSGVEVQAHGALFAGKDEWTKNDIASEVRSGDTILWWLRLPYRATEGNWQPGRMIHEKPTA
ncbi:hypothetical protein OHS70_38425 (plasmid) [Streptomyces sp. NBC_00390]|uniref:hypothetical protein n=1 Tax=Streptomyces sp. NBC_00390 TaxID=2975736 RepID=UPI002E21B627